MGTGRLIRGILIRGGGFILALGLWTGAFAQTDTARRLPNADTARRILNEGTITYRLQPTGVSPQESDILAASSFILSLKGNRVRTDFSGVLGTTATIYSSLTHSGALLEEYGQEKILVRMNREDFEDYAKPYHLTYTLTGDTSTIVGYLCKKALGKTASGDTLTIWYSPDLLPQNKETNFLFSALPGLPLAYESKMGTARVMYQAVKVSLDPVPSAKFDIPKGGYRELSYAESKKLM